MPSSTRAPSFRVLALATGAVGLCMAAFLLIAEDLVDGGGLIPHDEAVLNWFVDTRTEPLVQAARLVSALGSFVALAVAAVVLAALLRRRGTPWPLAGAPAAALVVAGLASVSAKDLFGRNRPPVAVHAVTVNSASFPSGHATDATACLLAASFVLALVVAHRRRTQWLLVAGGGVAAALVGLSRLVLAVHWLSDVVAGAALGLAIAITVVVATWWWSTRTPSGAARRYAARGADVGADDPEG